MGNQPTIGYIKPTGLGNLPSSSVQPKINPAFSKSHLKQAKRKQLWDPNEIVTGPRSVSWVHEFAQQLPRSDLNTPAEVQSKTGPGKNCNPRSPNFVTIVTFKYGRLNIVSDGQEASTKKTSKTLAFENLVKKIKARFPR